MKFKNIFYKHYFNIKIFIIFATWKVSSVRSHCCHALRQRFRHLRTPQGTLRAHRHRRRPVYHGETWEKERVLTIKKEHRSPVLFLSVIARYYSKWQATVRPAITMETMLINLMRMFRDGPEVSLKGSPTVSPTTVALWFSEPFPPK